MLVARVFGNHAEIPGRDYIENRARREPDRHSAIRRHRATPARLKAAEIDRGAERLIQVGGACRGRICFVHFTRNVPVPVDSDLPDDILCLSVRQEGSTQRIATEQGRIRERSARLLLQEPSMMKR